MTYKSYCNALQIWLDHLGLITFLIGNSQALQLRKSDINVNSLRIELNKMKKDIKLLKTEIAKYKECIIIHPNTVIIKRNNIKLDGFIHLGKDHNSHVVLHGKVTNYGENLVWATTTFRGTTNFKNYVFFKKKTFFDEKPVHRYK